MSYDTSHKLFTAKDIEEYLGINSNTLYHWVQVRKLLEPKIKGYGRGKQHKYNMENLATLLLTKVLRSYKIELFEIEMLYKVILDPNFSIKKPNKNEEINENTQTLHVWKMYKSDREGNRKEGLYLSYWKNINLESPYLMSVPRVGRLNDIIEQLKDSPESRMMYDDEGNVVTPIRSYVLIDLISIIKVLEKETGMRF